MLSVAWLSKSQKAESLQKAHLNSMLLVVVQCFMCCRYLTEQDCWRPAHQPNRRNVVSVLNAFGDLRYVPSLVLVLISLIGVLVCLL